jgi:hypothetical protein
MIKTITYDDSLFVLMPKSLTAENGAKSALIGEFKKTIEMPCIECNGYGDSEGECEVCEGSGTMSHVVYVGWDTIKDIYRMAVEICAASQPEQQPEQAEREAFEKDANEARFFPGGLLIEAEWRNVSAAEKGSTTDHCEDEFGMVSRAASSPRMETSLSDEETRALSIYTPPFKFERGYVFDSSGHMVGDSSLPEEIRVRGWGRISYMEQPEQLQDKIGEMIANALTEYWQSRALLRRASGDK